MAKRPSVKEILELARKGGAAKPADEAPQPVEAEAPAAEEVVEAAPEPVAAREVPAPAADVPTAAKLGRPLTLKEKLAAARAGGAAAPAAPAAAKPAPAAEAAQAEESPAAAEESEAPARAVPAPAPSVGRPLTLAEKLAAARAGGATAAPAAAAKPAAAKPAAAPAAKAAVARTLPPLDKLTDPKDLAEALRQSGAKKAKESAAATAAKAAEAGGATPAKAATASKAATREKDSKPQTVLPKPSKAVAAASATGTATADEYNRRGFFIGSFLISWVALGWASFTAGCAIFTGLLTRFMFPNVLAEPPSTIKVGLPTNFEPEEVSERFKAEWGFWIVRSSRYNGQEIVYALQSVCTHLGCPPNWLAGEQKFKCPCHGSGFYISGVNFEGPAPRPLERFKVTLADDGQMVIDKSQKFQQELGQWDDPDSFINA